MTSLQKKILEEIKFSIIVASFNSEETISRTIQSIKNQNYQNVEVIFIDGGSEDNTVSIINALMPINSIVVSEPDDGIGDAWNKGLKLSTGHLIGILNSDDYYASDIFSAISADMGSIKHPVIGYGNVTLIDEASNSTRFVRGRLNEKIALLNGLGFLHPSVFFNREALISVGQFNSKINVAVDSDWLLRALNHDILFKKISSHTYMKLGGHSDLFRYTGMGEYLDALVRNGYTKKHVMLFFMFRFLGHLAKLFSK